MSISQDHGSLRARRRRRLTRSQKNRRLRATTLGFDFAARLGVAVKYHVIMPFARMNPKNLGRSACNTLGMARCYCTHSSGLGGKLGAVAAAL